MAEERRPAQETLENANDDNTGAALSLKAEGSPADSGGVNYAGTLMGKDPDGNLRFINTNLAGDVIIDSEGGEITPKWAQGTKENGSDTEVVVTSIPLTVDLLYKEFKAQVSCYRDTKWALVAVADKGEVGEVETIIAKGRCGTGNYDSNWDGRMTSYVAGAAGIQILELRAYNINALSDIDATIEVKEDITP